MRMPEEIITEYRFRKRQRGPELLRLRRITTLMGPDVVAVPLPEIDKSVASTVANLARLGLDQLSMRVGSTMPTPKFVPVRKGQRAETQARVKRAVVEAWWDASRMKLQKRRRARHFWGYASTATLLCPDFECSVPRWHVRDPLAALPADRIDLDDPVPDDCIFEFTPSYGWLSKRFPDRGLAGLRLPMDPFTKKVEPSTKVTVVEYVDAELRCLIAVGSATDPSYGPEHFLNAGAEWKVLEWWPNRAGCPLAVVPLAISLGPLVSRFEMLPGLYYQQSYLNALNIEAVKRGIFADTWLVARPNENPEVIEVADGLSGIVGQVKGGDLQTINLNPGYKTTEAIAQGERNMRIEGGIPAEFGGESTSTVRTGRRGDAILEQTVDFPVQEVQEIFETAMEAEVRIGIAIDKTSFGSVSISLYPRYGHMSRKDFVVTHEPTKLWDIDEVHVSYAMAGTDMNRLVVVVGQLLGMELLSAETARELIPIIEDADYEHDRTIVGGIERALLAAVQQKVADPNSPYGAADVGFMLEQVAVHDKTLYEAVDMLEERIARRQQAELDRGAAGLGPAPGETGAPLPMDQMAAIGAPSEAANNMTQFLNQARTARSAARVA